MSVRILGFLIFILNIPSSMNGQDANHWNNSYGPSSFLLPGGVIANNQDSVGFCFNPALLAHLNKTYVSVTGNFYNYNEVIIKDAFGKGFDLKSDGTSISPIAAAQVISLKLKNPITFGYALINQPIQHFSATQRIDTKRDVLAEYLSPGDEEYIGYHSYQHNSSETRGIFSIGIKATHNLAWGISTELNIHKQNYSDNTTSNAIWNQDLQLFAPITSNNYFYHADYTNVGFRLKLGLAYNINESHHFGLIVQIPSIRIGGIGTILSDVTIINLTEVQDEPLLNVLATTRQTDIKSMYKTPLSVGLGYNISLSRGQLYFVAEYFSSIDRYPILKSNDSNFIRHPIISQFFTNDLIDFVSESKSIVNFGINASHIIANQITGYVSFRTDYNFLSDRAKSSEFEGVLAHTSIWSQYHLQLGINIIKRKFNFRFGILNSWGRSNDYNQRLNFDNISNTNFLEGELGKRNVNKYSFSWVFSYIKNI